MACDPRHVIVDYGDDCFTYQVSLAFIGLDDVSQEDISVNDVPFGLIIKSDPASHVQADGVTGVD